MTNWYVNFGDGSTTGYFAVAKWAAVNTYAAGSIVRQLAAPAIGSERCFFTAAGGISGTVEPTWVLTHAAAQPGDGTVADWVECTGAQARQGAGGSAWTAPHARLANAFASGWAAAGDSVYIASNHAETQATAIILTSPGTAANPCFIYCVSSTSSIPPVSGNLATTATISTTGNSSLSFLSTAYYYGVTFQCGNSSNAANLTFASGGAAGHNMVFEACVFSLVETGAGVVQLGNVGVFLRWINCQAKFAATSQGIQPRGAYFQWLKSVAFASGSTIPTTVFSPATAADVYCEGVDFSAAGSGKTLAGTNGVSCPFYFKDCALGVGVTLAATPAFLGANVFSSRVDSAGTNYMSQKASYTGNQTPETIIIRSGGASNGTTGISWKLTATANSKWLYPFEAIPIQIRNTVLSTNRTVNLRGICQLATIPNNDDTWFDAEYLGSAGTPLGSFGAGTKADGLAAGAALTTDTASNWTDQASAYQTANAYGTFTGVIKAGNASPQQLWFMASHSGTGTSGASTTIFNGQADGAQVTDNAGANQIIWQAMMRFQLTVTLSSPQPAQNGYLFVYPKVAKASATYWWDPLITLG